MSPVQAAKPTLAVWKFSSCDGCQLTLLNCEDELLSIAGALTVASFTEASSTVLRGPYDLSIVEGSITTPDDAARIRQVRENSRFLVTVGACATSGGIQALRNFSADLAPVVYPHPEYIDALRASTPIADHIRVDFELRGCPVDREQLLEVVTAFLCGRKPRIRAHSVCVECKRAGHACVLVAHGTPCLGPVTSTGCGALCPAFGRGCYGCFGPMESPNTPALAARWRQLGAAGPDLVRAFRSFTGAAEAFRTEAVRAEAVRAEAAASEVEEGESGEPR
jgi:coenzyme F420-reducing hydrogenase gamma subunit